MTTTTSPYVWIKVLFDKLEKGEDIVFLDLRLVCKFKLFMLAPVAVYEGFELEAVCRKVEKSDLDKEIENFSVLYTVSLKKYADVETSDNVKEYYVIRGVLKEKFQLN